MIKDQLIFWLSNVLIEIYSFFSQTEEEIASNLKRLVVLSSCQYVKVFRLLVTIILEILLQIKG